MPLKKTTFYFIPVVSVILALLTTMSPFAIDTYLPAMPQMSKFFGVPMNQVELTVTLYFLGFALGNFLGGPLSDSFGRKPVALTGIVIYGFSAFLIPFAPTIDYVWLLRLLQAFGGGFATVTAMVFVRDWFEGKQVARMATLIGMIMMLAPLFAPVIGTFILHQSGWTGIFHFLTGLALLLLIIVSLFLGESRNKNLLTRQLTSAQLWGNYKQFFRHRKAVLMLLTISFSSAGLFTFLTGASFMYITYYGFGQKLFPVLFASNMLLQIILSFSNTLFLKKFEPEQLLRAGIFIQFVAAVVLGVTVLVMPHPEFWLVFLSIVLYIGCLGLIFGNGTAIVLNLLPEISGSANATIGVVRFLVSFLAGSLPALFHSNNLEPIGLTITGCSLMAATFGYFFSRIHLQQKRRT